MSPTLLRLALVLFINPLIILGQKAPIADESKIPIEIRYYIDTSHGLELEDISKVSFQSNFKKSKQSIVSLGKGDFTAWFRCDFELPSATPKSPWHLEIAYPTFDTLELYFYADSMWQVKRVGDVWPFHDRDFKHRNFVFSLDHLPLGKQHTLYFRINSRGSMIFPASVGTLNHFHSKHTKEDIIYGLFYGIMLVMLLYNLFLSYATRSSAYIYYVLIILGNIMTLSALNGHAFQYIWYDMPWWGNHVIVFGIGLWICASNLFARKFFDARIFSNFFNVVFISMASIGALISLSAFVVPYETGMLMGNMFLPVNCVLLFISGVYFWIKGQIIAKLFTTAWTLYLFGVLIYNFRSLGHLPVNFLTGHIMEIGAVLEVIMLSLALGLKYRRLEEERNVAQDEAIRALASNQKIIEEQNEALEQTVNERTEELRHRQEEAIAQNEKLRAQSLELQHKNQALEEAQSIIQTQNEKLRDYTDNLEKEVAARTMEIRLANHELADNVQKLEQYAYITAHNLRAPVARLLGLIHLLEIKPAQENDQEIGEIIGRVKNSATELNDVIKDINTILEVRKEVNAELAICNIEEKINKSLLMLKETIEKQEAEVSLDLREKEVFTNPVYLDSIIYNLLSNAIKYRHPDRKPQITIQSKLNQTNEYIIVSVIDNGLGIDLEAHRDKLFGMYRRFHANHEGKGLGLYLVKSQIESLGGRIKVESTVNEGSCFSLYFKK